MPTFRKNHKAVETRFFDEPVLVTLDDSLKKALEFMAHGKGTDDPSSSLFTKRHQVSERHSGVLKSFPLRGGRLHKPTAPEAWSRDSRPAQPGTLNPGWSSEPLEPDDTSSSR